MLNEDFHEVLSALSREGAEYLLVGGYALAAYGILRATSDMDLWIAPGEANAGRVEAALRGCGIALGEPETAALRQPAQVLRLGQPPQQLDIHTSLTGVEFAAAYPSRLELTFDGLVVPALGPAALVANKRALRRPMDRVDLEQLAAEFEWLQERGRGGDREAFHDLLDRVCERPPLPGDEL